MLQQVIQVQLDSEPHKRGDVSCPHISSQVMEGNLGGGVTLVVSQEELLQLLEVISLVRDLEKKKFFVHRRQSSKVGNF